MNIAIQKGMENYKKILEEKGHRVFYAGEEPNVDAVLYKEVDTHPYYDINNMPSATSAVSNSSSSYGVLLVNVLNKTEEEVLRILEKRVYSPLF